MFNIGDYVVYKREVCLVKDYLKNHINGLDYYSLVPVSDSTLKIDIPVNNKFLKKVLTKEEVEKIINNIPNVDVIKVDDRVLEQEYKRLLKNDDYNGLIAIIKTTYLRNKTRVDNKKKISEKDDEYFKRAEKYLYTEFMIALDKSYDEIKDYVASKVEELCQ